MGVGTIKYLTAVHTHNGGQMHKALCVHSFTSVHGARAATDTCSDLQLRHATDSGSLWWPNIEIRRSYLDCLKLTHTHRQATSYYAERKLRWALVGRWKTTCLLWIWMKLCMTHSSWHESFIHIVELRTTRAVAAHMRHRKLRQSLPPLCHYCRHAWLRRDVNWVCGNQGSRPLRGLRLASLCMCTKAFFFPARWKMAG